MADQQHRFDFLARGLATNQLSRGQVLKSFVAGVLLATPLGALSNRTASAQAAGCSIQTFPNKGTNFTGSPINADKDFFDSLRAIDKCAGANNVEVFITGDDASFRPPGANPGGVVPGVKPAKHSNHKAGHAIDMNVDHNGCPAKKGGIRRCNSQDLHPKKLPKAPQQVQDFIQCIQDTTPRLRWGGDIKPVDPVHIDDNLYKKNSNAWKKRVNASACPSGSTCVNGACCQNAHVCNGRSVCCKQACKQDKCTCGGVMCPANKPDCCNGQCVNTQTDSNNCGACGNTCKSGQTCNQGKCEKNTKCGGVSCSPGYDCCSGWCVDLQRNPSHCGACGNDCGLCTGCYQGTCGCGSPGVQCPPGQYCCLWPGGVRGQERCVPGGCVNCL